MIDEKIARMALDLCLEAGADKARVTLSHCSEDLVSTLNAEVDRVTHCEDNALSINLFVDGRYGVFSTNNMSYDSLREFVYSCIDIVKSLSVDSCRDLPLPENCCNNALDGNELELYSVERDNFSPQKRIEIALNAAVFDKNISEYIVSEEGEYSDSNYETIILDSNGLVCRHKESSFDYGVEITVEVEGEKYSSYYWDSSSDFASFDCSQCGKIALDRALSKRDSESLPSGIYNMVVDSEVASRLVSPILRALNGGSIQQNNSFLMSSLGKKVFSSGLNIVDVPHRKGESCSKLFDSEGVATKDSVIIENGVVKEYFLSTYYSAKLGLSPTNEAATRPLVLPYPQNGLDKESIMKLCGTGIYVTDFNGGNSNPVSGDFSFGVEGFYFVDGKIVSAVSEMLVTGNFISLWNNLIACGEDARPCMSKLIPTLAFQNVDFSG